VDQLPPELPRFPPAGIGRVVAKAKVERQRDTENREGCCARLREPDAETGTAEKDRDQGGVQRKASDVRQDSRQHGALHHEQQATPAGTRADDHR
jgi:hypothetical protein